MKTLTTSLFDFEYLPASRKNPAGNEKLMIILHGYGDSAKAYRDIRRELGLPHMNYLVLNGPRRQDDGFSWFMLRSKNEMFSLSLIRRRLFALVGELNQQGWLSKNIFWLGHSQGCAVAADLVLSHPHTFGGMIGVSGYACFPRGWKSRFANSGAYRTPWLFTHGTRDRLIPVSEVRKNVEALLDTAVPLDYREFAKGHDFDMVREVPFIRRWIASRQTERI